MATYTPPTIVNYNDNPPTNDGSLNFSSNGVDWNRHIDEIGNPIVAYANAINTATDTAFDDIADANPVNAVLEYGANNSGAGAGATDTEAQINNAIAAVAATGRGSVFLPAGIYDIGSAIALAPNVRLYGEGPGITTLRATSNGITMLNYLASASIKSFFNIEDMTISSNNKTTVNGIVIDGASVGIRCNDIRLESLYITGGLTNDIAKGIRLDYCVNTSITDVFCVNNFRGIELEMCADTDIANCKIQNGDGSGIWMLGDGSTSAADEGTRITACSTNGQKIGITGNSVDFINISNSSFTTADSGPLIAINCDNWSITGTEFAEATTPATAAIDMNSTCLNWCIIGNYIFSSNWGLDLDGAYHTVQGNVFDDNMVNDVILAAGCTHSVVTNNVCKSAASGNSITETAGGNYNQLIHNTCQKNVAKTGANSLVGYVTTTGVGDNLVY